MNDTTHQKALSAIHDDPHGAAWRPDVEEHVGRCPACQKTVRALRSFVGSMRRRQQTVAAPPELVAQVCRTVQAEQDSRGRRRTTILRLAIPAALAAGLLIGLVLPRPQAPGGATDVVAPSVADLLDDALHDRFLLDGAGRTVEFATGDPAEASSWLSSELGFDVALAESAPAGWQLEGARLWHTVGALSALATYARADGAAGAGGLAGAGETITVFARPASGLEVVVPTDAPEGSTVSWRMESADHRGVAWVDGSLAWVAIGSGPIEDVAAWVEAYRAH